MRTPYIYSGKVLKGLFCLSLSFPGYRIMIEEELIEKVNALIEINNFYHKCIPSVHTHRIEKIKTKAMTKEDWEKIKWFGPGENWGNPERMDSLLIFYLDKLREFIGHKIIIHCGTQGNHTELSYHYTIPCKATDCHAEGMSLLDFYLAAERFDFGGIGVYPTWHFPGLHLDTRPIEVNSPGARWGRVHNLYTILNDEFIKKYLIKE